jgi:hypothetical protein
VEARLVDQVATHEDVDPGAVCGSGEKLIDSSAPGESWLLKKVTPGAFGSCGSKMPIVGSLSASEVECLRSWVMSF